MRGKDRAQLIQISGVTYISLGSRIIADDKLYSLRRTYLVYREAWRMRESTMLICRRCITLNAVSPDLISGSLNIYTLADEAQRLRDMLRDRDREIRELEEAVNAHSTDEEKLTQEIQALENEVKRLEADLSQARHAESHLQVQKQENLVLKETIDRMRFDLDEARAAAALAGGGTGRNAGSAAASSAGGTLSRNLGDELGRRLVAVEHMEEEEVEDAFVETIVTTQRTRKVGGRSGQSTSSSSQSATVHIEEGIREYIDASTATDSTLHEAIPSEPPAYTAMAPPINSDQVLQRAHPRDHKHLEELLGSGEAVVEGEEEYEALVDALGVRCTVLEDEVKMKKFERAKHGGGEVCLWT